MLCLTTYKQRKKHTKTHIQQDWFIQKTNCWLQAFGPSTKDCFLSIMKLDLEGPKKIECDVMICFLIVSHLLPGCWAKCKALPIQTSFWDHLMLVDRVGIKNEKHLRVLCDFLRRPNNKSSKVVFEIFTHVHVNLAIIFPMFWVKTTNTSKTTTYKVVPCQL